VPPEAKGIGYWKFPGLTHEPAERTILQFPGTVQAGHAEESSEQEKETAIGLRGIYLLMLGWFLALLWLQHWVPYIWSAGA